MGPLTALPLYLFVCAKPLHSLWGKEYNGWDPYLVVTAVGPLFPVMKQRKDQHLVEGEKYRLNAKAIFFVVGTGTMIVHQRRLSKAGRINVNEMRLIMLMHPEYQINNKNIGRKVLGNAEICNEVAEEQHGSKKNYQAGLLLLNKVLVGDLFRLTKFSGCYAINDAKRCYDRIDHNFAILTLIFLGYPG